MSTLSLLLSHTLDSKTESCILSLLQSHGGFEVIVLVWSTTFLLFAPSSFGVLEGVLSDFV